MNYNYPILFSFLKYVHPVHYFQLFQKNGASIFPVPSELPEKVLDQLETNNIYQNSWATEYDKSWCAIQQGYIGNARTFTTFEKLPVIDEYRFLRKYFHPVWSFYVLLIRLISFYNPLTEIAAWYQSSNVSRSNWLQNPLKYDNWKSFQSSLLEKEPLISIIIPTLNRYKHLKNILSDFENQDYKKFEIIIVDQSEPFQSKFYEKFKLDLNVIRQEEKALWLARNTAVKASRGEIIALSEDDVRISSNWITNHLKCLDFFKADVSAGVFYPEGSTIPRERSFFTVASQFATGNAMLYKDVFRNLGSFDRQFEKQRMGDGEFGLRIYLEGYRSVSNPFASCLDVKAGTGGFRQLGSWDAFRPKSAFSPRPFPSVLYFYRKYFGRERSILALLKAVPPSIIPYQFKKNKKLMILGGLISLLLFPLVLFQVFKSWELSGKKLREGNLISEIK